MTPTYTCRGAGLRYGSTAVLRDVDLTLNQGELVTIAGPNGAGKSSLIGILAGLRQQIEGECRLLDKDVRSWDRREFAKLVALVPQSLRVDFSFTAEQVVLMGRTPFVNGLFESDADHDAVTRAMELTETTQFRNRDFRTLSGGERQRVIVASALAQSPRVLLLDEPTTHLDIEHQISLFRLLRSMRNDGVLVIAVSHDLNLSAAYSDRVVLLSAGQCVADGHPETVFAPDAIRRVFHVGAEVDRGRIFYDL